MPGMNRVAIVLAAFGLICGCDLVQVGISSVNTDGDPANGHSANAAISQNGRFVAYESVATNLSNVDTGGTWENWQVYVRDTVLRTTELVSVSGDCDAGSCAPVDNLCGDPEVSNDGRYVAFFCAPSANAHASEFGLYVRDRKLKHTRLIPDSTYAARFRSFTDDSRELIFQRAGMFAGAYAYDFETEATSIVLSDQNVTGVSGDGRFLVFASAEPVWNGGLFVDITEARLFDRDNGTTEALTSSGVSLSAARPSAPEISRDGRFVAYELRDGNDSMVRLIDRDSDTDVLVSIADNGQTPDANAYLEAISPDGSVVAFRTQATNVVEGKTGNSRLYIRDLQTATTKLACDDATQICYWGSLGNSHIAWNGGDANATVAQIFVDRIRAVEEAQEP